MNKWLIVLAFITSFSLFSQDYKQNIEKEFSDYLETIVNKDFEKSVGYILPEFFEIVPKDQMIQIMEQSFNNPEMEISLKDPKILNIEDKQHIEDQYYALLSYSNTMIIKFIDEEEESQEFTNAIKQSFDQTFGSENVKYNEESGSFEIYSVKKVCAISEDGKSAWKFLVLEKNQKEILKRILPQSIIEKI